MDTPEKDEWISDDFAIEAFTSNEFVMVRPHSVFNWAHPFSDRRRKVVEPFLASGLGLIQEKGTGCVCFLGLCRVMDDLISTMTVALARERPMLTIVGEDARRLEDPGDFPGDFFREPIPPVRIPWHSRIVRRLLDDDRLPRAEALDLTRQNPLDIPGYHLRAVISLAPKEGCLERLFETLRQAGLCGLEAEDMQACDMLFIPSFCDEGSQQEPFFSVIHRHDESDFVNRTIRDEAAKLGFTLD